MLRIGGLSERPKRDPSEMKRTMGGGGGEKRGKGGGEVELTSPLAAAAGADAGSDVRHLYF